MPDIPYKQLMEDGEPFYPVTGPSSFNGVLPVSKGGTGADNAAAAHANLGIDGAGGLTLDLLWTNPSPSAQFAAQTLSLDLTGYKLLMIERADRCQYDFLTTDTGALYAYLQDKASSYIGYRAVKVDSTGLYFLDYFYAAAYGGSLSTTDNSRMIPNKIYGLK